MSYRSLPVLVALGLSACAGDLPTTAPPASESGEISLPAAKVSLSVSQADAEILTATVEDVLTRILPSLSMEGGMVQLRAALTEIQAALASGDALQLAAATERAHAAIRALEGGAGAEGAAILADLSAVSLALVKAEQAIPGALRAGIVIDR